MSQPVALCLDGPLNGRYATTDEAVPLGYWRDFWPGDEPVWVHGAPMDVVNEGIEESLNA